MASADELEDLSQQQHERFRVLFGSNPANGNGFTDISNLGQQVGHQVQDARAGVISSNFSTAVIPALGAATSADHNPFNAHARVAATAAEVSDASAAVNVRGAAAVLANSQNEAAQIAAIPDRNSPEGIVQALNTIGAHQAKSLDTVERSAATEQQLGQRAARSHIQAAGFGAGQLPQAPPPPLDPPPPAPTIAGPGSPPVPEPPRTGQPDDLDSTIPGTGIALGGDGVGKYPNVVIPPNGPVSCPVPHPPGTRPLPTGTALGPHGEQYGFFAIVPIAPPGQPQIYTAPDTVVVDLAHPDKILYTLHGISQASGAYDAATDKMVILGNDAGTTRTLWESAPLSQNANWGNTLAPIAPFQGVLNGTRESQIVALPHGKGFLLVGATDQGPIEGAVASTPEGLLQAAPTQIAAQMADTQWPYGPTITDIQEGVDGQMAATMRLSTFGIGTYDPRTYTTTFPITAP